MSTTGQDNREGFDEASLAVSPATMMGVRLVSDWCQLGVSLVSAWCQMDRSLLGSVHGHTQSRHLTVRLDLVLGVLVRTTQTPGQDYQEGFYDGFPDPGPQI